MYCKLCKRNLPYGIVQHDCVFGLAPGQIHPDMNPDYLYNQVWWEAEEEILYKGKAKEIYSFSGIEDLREINYNYEYEMNGGPSNRQPYDFSVEQPKPFGKRFPETY